MSETDPALPTMPEVAAVREGIILGSSNGLWAHSDLSLRYGTFGCGLNLLPLAWPKAEHAFEVDGSLRLRTEAFPGRPPSPSQCVHPDQASVRLLLDSPVEVLVVDQSSLPPSQWKAN